ncbi:MAG: MoaD/ThiS family protein [Candidatus Saccharicenans sp.]|nr:MAG: hypothetical protein C0168_11495 [Candidatus Aminicenantes bacterium]HEK86248.1 hypothetical protein [Candidatus Aminicenantes bacterium]
MDKNTIKVTIKLIGPLINQVGFSEKLVEMPEGVTVEKLVSTLPLDPNRPKIITKNGQAVAPNVELKDGDRIAISPIYSGG